ncbi:MAG: ATP-binding cassette domain-containing protein [Chloroflexota bacterium]|nr:ATP-binding cassette domain-containing protein [Chloroflexota bacterium]
MDSTLAIVLILAVAVILILRIVFRQRHRGSDILQSAEPEPPPDGAALAEQSEPPESVTDAPEGQTRLRAGIPTEMRTPVQNEDHLQTTVEVAHVSKSFGGREVVEDVSFTLHAGEVFGLVGPNGAGKTTTIRMLMDIIRPDAGEIRLYGQPLDESTKNRIGYLPEERGLYRRMTVSDSLVYLASLKDVDRRVATERAEALLSQVDMSRHRKKKIGELSRGMGQIIQFVVTVAHDPDLIVLDEPFAGLDPLNRQVLKEIVLSLKEQGKTIILSTHMMNEVEEMCDRIMMIDRGHAVLYGDLAEIKWRYRNNSVLVDWEGDADTLEGVANSQVRGRHVELFLAEGTTPQDILNQLVARNAQVNCFQVSTASLNEIFIQVAGKAR